MGNSLSIKRKIRNKSFHFLSTWTEASGDNYSEGWRERNQQDATNLMFIIKLLSQHVSDITMPIFRRTRLCTTAYDVLHWLCWPWLCGAGTRAVCTVWKLLFDCSCPISTQSQPAQPVQNTTCSSTRSCSPDDGHNDARNMLKYKFDNKHLISCILLVSLSSPYVHDARSQEPETKAKLQLGHQSFIFPQC